MKILKKQICLLGMALTLGFASISAQTLNEAKAWYEKGNYAQAKPVFQRFYKSQPANGNYCLWYGVCSLETGDAEAAVKPLETAVKKRVKSGQYHLARAYDRTYRYEEAEEVCSDYLSDLERLRRSTDEAERLLSDIRSHLRMMKGVERVCVIDSFVCDKQSFLQAYKIGPEAGTLSLYTDYFKDNGRQGGTVYENELGSKLYYSEIQPDSTSSILSRSKLSDGWSKGTLLPGSINEGINAGYPFVMGDGTTLYYAADGPESMGGTDIFVTRYNTNTDTYLVPENVGMPFNSPYNDYMYAVDEYNNLGWFASDRYQPADKVCVYVFIPNASKQVYDYDTTDKDRLVRLASLKDISLTWADTTLVADARRRLASAIAGKPQVKKQKRDFEFLINDETTYYQLSDFRSPQAKTLFGKYRQLEQSFAQQSEKLEKGRRKYAEASAEEKKQLAPAILDLEQRILTLRKEVNEAAKAVRRAEAGVQ